MTTIFEESRAKIDAAKEALADLERKARSLQLEIIRLSTSEDVDDRLRRKELLELRTEILDDQIPDAEKAVKNAEDAHKVVRDQRTRKAKTLAIRVALRERYGEHLAALQQVWDTEEAVFRAVGYPDIPAHDFLRDLRDRRSWLNSVRKAVESIPRLEEELAEFGDDPDGEWRDPNVLSEEELSFRRANRLPREEVEIMAIDRERDAIRAALAGAR